MMRVSILQTCVMILVMTVSPSSVSGFIVRVPSILHNRNFQRSRIPAKTLWFAQGNGNNDDNAGLDTSETTSSAASLRALTFHQIESPTTGEDDDDDDDLPELIADFLMELGAVSTSITDHDRDTEFEHPVFKDESDNTNTTTLSSSWRRSDVCAHFAASFNLPQIVQDVESTFLDHPQEEEEEEKKGSLRYSVENVDDNLDWMKQVQQSWKPVVCSGFVLRLPWHTAEDVSDAITKSGLLPESISEKERLLLQGGIAFGSGDHPTTRLCLSYVRKHVTATADDTKEHQMFLDYGSGSGVLGMAACALNPRIRAVGVEIDADSVRIANANAELNHNLDMTSYLPKLDRDRLDDESLSVAIKGFHNDDNEELVKQLPNELDRSGLYDMGVANILAEPLVGLAPIIADLLKVGAPLGLSGVLVGQADRVMDAYRPFFENVCIVDEEEGWVLISGVRKQS